MHPQHNDTVFTVIRVIAAADRSLKGREKTACLSRQARCALELSARKSGIILPSLAKAENGAPQPFGSFHWSLTHKSAYVGAVVAGSRIGIDLERIRPVHPGLYRKTASEKEWGLSGEEPLELFFRYWTAKEAVLKAAGTGIADLERCRISAVADRRRLQIDYLNETWTVEHVFFDGHVAAIVKTAKYVDWTLVGENGRQTNLLKEKAGAKVRLLQAKGECGCM